jgi:hypothetical protein
LEALYFDVEISLALRERLKLCEVVEHELIKHVFLITLLAKILPAVLKDYIKDLIVLLESFLQAFFLALEII